MGKAKMHFFLNQTTALCLCRWIYVKGGAEVTLQLKQLVRSFNYYYT